MSGSRPVGGGGGSTGSGTVTSVGTGTGLTGGPITTSGTISFATIADQRFIGNWSGGTAAPQAMSLVAGTGITFSGNTTSLTITATSGAGTVTQVNTGTGLTGGPITSSGTVSLATITTGYFMANFSGATAAPVPVQLVAGSGITFSGVTTSLTITASGGSGTVTNVATGAGLTGGPITTTGTISVATAGITPSMLSFTPGLVWLATSTPTSTTTVTFNTIASLIPAGVTLHHLMVLADGRGDAATTILAINMIFNGDSGANYDMEEVGDINGGYTPNVGAAQSAIQMGLCEGATATAGYGGFGKAIIFNYADTNLFKRCEVSGGAQAGTAQTGFIQRNGYAGWRSSNAITRIDVSLSSGSWVAGSIVSLYGLA